jgi:antitoxin (DNA-binding transcriptional repressor) of toxin-antitoxin stability system
MHKLSIREMRAALPRIEQLLAEAGEVLITRNGKPVARVLPTVPGEGIPSRAELRRRMCRVAVGSEVLIREDRNARG